MADVRVVPGYGFVKVSTGANVRVLPDYGVVNFKAAAAATGGGPLLDANRFSGAPLVHGRLVA